MPPLHPDFVHFPIALLTVAFAAELLAAFVRRPRMRQFAWVCLLLGFLGLILTAASGFIDMRRADLRHETHELVDLHWRLGVVLTILVTVLVVWRWLQRRSADFRTPVAFLAYFTFVFAVLCVQGWFGGELAYAHGAGAAATGQGMVSQERAAQRVMPLASALHRLPGFAEHAHDAEAGPHEHDAK